MRFLAEEIRLGRDDDVGATAVPAYVEPAHDRDRDAVELAEDQLCCPGDLVRDCDPCRMQLIAGRIALAREVAYDLHTGGADRDVRRRGAPGPAERVRDDDSD